MTVAKDGGTRSTRPTLRFTISRSDSKQSRCQRDATGAAGVLSPSLSTVAAGLCAVAIGPGGSPVPSAVVLPKNNIVLSSDNGPACHEDSLPESSKTTCLRPRYDGDLCMQIIAFSKWDELVPHAESWDRLAAAFLSSPGHGFRAGGGTMDRRHHLGHQVLMVVASPAIQPRISWCWAHSIRRAAWQALPPGI